MYKCLLGRVPQKNVTKKLLGFVRRTYFFFLTPLQIFVPHLKILFFINCYFQYVYLSTLQVCVNLIDIFIFILSQKSSGTVYCHTITLRSRNITRNRTPETKTVEGRCVQSLDCVFVTSSTSVLLLCFLSAYLLFYFCLSLILISPIRLLAEV